MKFSSNFQVIICAYQLNPDTYATDGELEKIRKERGYTYEDEVISRQTTFWLDISQQKNQIIFRLLAQKSAFRITMRNWKHFSRNICILTKRFDMSLTDQDISMFVSKFDCISMFFKLKFILFELINAVKTTNGFELR